MREEFAAVCLKFEPRCVCRVSPGDRPQTSARAACAVVTTSDFCRLKRAKL